MSGSFIRRARWIEPDGTVSLLSSVPEPGVFDGPLSAEPAYAADGSRVCIVGYNAFNPNVGPYVRAYDASGERYATQLWGTLFEARSADELWFVAQDGAPTRRRLDLGEDEAFEASAIRIVQ